MTSCPLMRADVAAVLRTSRPAPSGRAAGSAGVCVAGCVAIARLNSFAFLLWSNFAGEAKLKGERGWCINRRYGMHRRCALVCQVSAAPSMVDWRGRLTGGEMPRSGGHVIWNVNTVTEQGERYKPARQVSVVPSLSDRRESVTEWELGLLG